MLPLVSVVIPTYNRYKFLLRAIDSIKNQTYIKNGGQIEVIIVNDKSTEQLYTSSQIDSIENCSIKMITLEENSKSKLGYACAGYVRNIGVKNSSGEYVAFLDDDDWWTKDKVEVQVNKMIEIKIDFSCTDGYLVNKDKTTVYNREFHWNYLKKAFGIENEFPNIWTLDFLKRHNGVITSSVMLKRSLFNSINGMKLLRNGQEDYDCWLRCLEKTNLVYINKALFYYDNHHGYGQNY
jgi:glycosyltransferase involved in cell wall biosynthesis